MLCSIELKLKYLSLITCTTDIFN